MESQGKGISIRNMAVFLSFIVSLVLAVYYNLNQFYLDGRGIVYPDLLAGLVKHVATWHFNDPPTREGVLLLKQHDPAFYFHAVLYEFLLHIGFAGNSVLWYGILQGLWSGLTSASLFMLMTSGVSKERPVILLGSLALSILAAFIGVAAECVYLPNFETAIPALFFAFLAFRQEEYKKLSYLLLLMGMMIYSGAGLHYAGILISLAMYFFWFEGAQDSRQKAVSFLVIGLMCLTYSIVSLIFQKSDSMPGVQELVAMYLGSPFVHAKENLLERAQFWVPLLILLSVAFSIYERRVVFCIGILVVIQWVFFLKLSAGAIHWNSHGYMSFPVATALLWPFVGNGLSPKREDLGK